MDDLLKAGQWWWLLIVPTATFIFAVLGAALGTRLGKTVEHKQWLRNSKQEAYVDFLNAAADLTGKMNITIRNVTDEEIAKLDKARLPVRLVANAKARESSTEILMAFRDVQKHADSAPTGVRSWKAGAPETEELKTFKAETDRLSKAVQRVSITFTTAARADLGAKSRGDKELDKRNEAIFSDSDPLN